MSNKTGRKSKYETHIKPYIADIRKAVEAGATVEEIATAYGIAQSTLHKYQTEHVEFMEAFARGREKVCIEVKAALLKKALGYDYEEKKQYITTSEDGSKKTHTEIMTRHMPPSETAGAMILRNYDKSWRDKDAITTELKQQEQELRKAIAESTNFNLEI